MLHLSPMRRTVPDHVLSTVPTPLSTAFALSVQRKSPASTDGPKAPHGSIYGSAFGGMALQRNAKELPLQVAVGRWRIWGLSFIFNDGHVGA